MKRLTVVLLVALAACGSSSKSGPSLPAGQYDLGDGVSVAVHEVLDPVVRQPDHPVQPGYRWVGIDIEFFNSTDHVVDDMWLNYGCQVHTADGRQPESYVPTYTVNEMSDVPNAIPPHSSARGWDVYQVPDGTTLATALCRHVGDDPVTINL
jgi:hypothetical protein